MCVCCEVGGETGERGGKVGTHHISVHLMSITTQTHTHPSNQATSHTHTNSQPNTASLGRTRVVAGGGAVVGVAGVGGVGGAEPHLVGLGHVARLALTVDVIDLGGGWMGRWVGG